MTEAKLLYFPFSIVLILITKVRTETKIYYVGETCLQNEKNFTVGDNDEYRLIYTGNTYLPHIECIYKFSPSNSNSKLCIKAYLYMAYNCHLWVDFYGANILTRHYSCSETPGDYCDPDGGQTLFVKFRNGNSFKKIADDIRIKILVEEESPFDYVVLAIVLSSIAGVGILTFMVVMICTRCKKAGGDSVSPESFTTDNSLIQSRRQHVNTELTTTHEMSTQYSPPTSSTEPTYEENGIHKPHHVSPSHNEHSSYLPLPESSRPPLVPSAPSYDNEPPPSYEQAMAKTMDA